MAVYTEVSEVALSRHLEQYDIGAVLSLKGIAGGVENTNYLLHTEAGEYILTLYEKRVAKEDLPFFIGLMDHLAHNEFNCPKPIRMRSGEALGELEGRPACIVSFLEGMEVSYPKSEHAFRAGVTLACLHQAATGFSIKRKNALGPNGWQPLFEDNIDRADEVEAGLEHLLRSQLPDITSQWPDNIPTGVIHADFFKDNVFFLNGDVSGVIDFYFACNDLLAYDLAIAINAWCFDKELAFQRDLATAIVSGYQSIRPLEEAEFQALPLLARAAALRFLLTRLNDWLHVPEDALVIPHDPKAFSARLRFFAAISDPTEMGA